MAPNKSPADLVKIGLEGFAMLDECFGHKKKQQQPQPQAPPQYRQHRYLHQSHKPQVQVITPIPAAAAMETVRIDCFDEAKFYGGTVIADYPINNFISSRNYSP